MREVFQQELAEVQNRLIEIARLVANSMEHAVSAFNSSDVSLAEGVIENDATIDSLAIDLDELAITIIARQQPVARDLRVVVSALRMSASLERMGDLAEHIARLARTRYPERVVPQHLRNTFIELGRRDIDIANKLIRVIETEDEGLIDELVSDDIFIDELHQSVFELVLGEQFSGETQIAVDITLASRYFERFADHAVSIAKKVQYLATGSWSDALAHDPAEGVPAE